MDGMDSSSIVNFPKYKPYARILMRDDINFQVFKLNKLVYGMGRIDMSYLGIVYTVSVDSYLQENREKGKLILIDDDGCETSVSSRSLIGWVRVNDIPHLNENPRKLAASIRNHYRVWADNTSSIYAMKALCNKLPPELIEFVVQLMGVK